MMRSSNPALNEKVFRPERTAVIDTTALGRPGFAPPAGGPVQAGAVDTMTIGGVVEKSAFLLLLLVASAAFGWSQVDRAGLATRVPGWLIVALLGGLAIAVVTILKPKLSPYTAPAYALVQGLVVGAISAVYAVQYDGIVLQAVGLTVGVFAVMLGLYALRIIKVTDKLRSGIMVATGAVLVVYLASFVLRIFGADVPFIHETGTVGILVSLAIVGIAAANLLLDFDMVERGAAGGAAKHLEWYGAFGLIVTLVWLYLELLRLLAKLRDR